MGVIKVYNHEMTILSTLQETKTRPDILVYNSDNHL